jgi:hypothetical protein
VDPRSASTNKIKTIISRMVRQAHHDSALVILSLSKDVLRFPARCWKYNYEFLILSIELKTFNRCAAGLDFFICEEW